MSVEEISAPTPGPEELKVKMVSSRVNPVDIDLMKGMPFLTYKRPQVGGIDGAGIITETGSKITDYQVGDAVFFYRQFTDIGTWGEEITIKAEDVAPIPSNISPQDAGAIALPVLTAYDALGKLDVKSGESILIHGAGGGVGFQAVQIARYLGLDVVATASERDFDLLRSVGVQRLINYKTEDFAQVLKPTEVDYVFDVIGGEVLQKSISLRPKKVVSVSFPDVDSMHKTGINMPGFLKAIMKLANRKIHQASQKEPGRTHRPGNRTKWRPDDPGPPPR